MPDPLCAQPDCSCEEPCDAYIPHDLWGSAPWGRHTARILDALDDHDAIESLAMVTDYLHFYHKANRELDKTIREFARDMETLRIAGEELEREIQNLREQMRWVEDVE